MWVGRCCREGMDRLSLFVVQSDLSFAKTGAELLPVIIETSREVIV